MKGIGCNFVACFCFVFLALFWLRSCSVLSGTSHTVIALGLSVSGDLLCSVRNPHGDEAHSSLSAGLCATLQILLRRVWLVGQNGLGRVRPTPTCVWLVGWVGSRRGIYTLDAG